jgi:GT2 family glycosyltransferase
MIRRIAKKIFPPGSRGHQAIKHHLEPLLYKMGYQPPSPAVDLTYDQWVRDIEPTTLSPVKDYKYKPLISIVVPAYNTPDKYLVPLLDSVISQTYPNWELCLVEGSPDPERAVAIRKAAGRDSRIRIVESGEDKRIVANTNAGLAVVLGEYVAFLDHDDTLTEWALNEIVAVLQDRPEIDWFYSDEDKLSEDGKQRLPFLFKPDWSPELFMNVNYVTHLTVVRASLAKKVGGLRTGYEGVQDYDFALRLLDHKPVIYHVRKILYHWRYADGSTALHPSKKSNIELAGVRALGEYLVRNNINAIAEMVPNAPTNYHVKYATPGNPKASLIIPFKDKVSVNKVMVDSILEKTLYPNYEIVLVDNRSELPETAAYLKEVAKNKAVKIVSYDQPFNWSAVNNFGRTKAEGRVMVFLNNDMEVLNSEWLTELVGVAIQPGVGEVGALLMYPTNPPTIQHAGVAVGFFGVAGHVFRKLTTGNFTYFGLADWPRNYLAVTGACVAVEADKFDQVGGFDEDFLTAGSDVRFGLALYEAGYRNVYWPFAKLKHYENVSVGEYNKRDDTQHDYDLSMKYYRPYIDAGDPYFNPNLSYTDPNSEQIRLGGPH